MKPPANRARAVAAALLTAMRAAVRALHGLGLEIAGFFFLVFAAMGAGAVWREYAALQRGESATGRLGLALGFSLLFAYFGVTSLLRARRKA